MSRRLWHLCVFDFLFVVWVVLLRCRVAATTGQSRICGAVPAECWKEVPNTFLPCFSHVPGTDCAYMKGSTGSLPRAHDYNFPAAPANLTVITYYFTHGIHSCKYPALNISWEIKLNSIIYALEGFLVEVVSNTNVNVTRVFNVSFNYTQLRKPVWFYHPCIIANYNFNSWYTVKVSSLPLPSTAEHDNSIENTVFIPSIKKVDANHTCGWTAPASIYCHNGSVMVTFSPAPVDFGFSVYNISLMSGPLLLQQLSVTTTDDEPVVVVLQNVTQGQYILRIQPHQVTPCMCRRGPEESNCCEFCTATDIPVTCHPRPVPPRTVPQDPETTYPVTTAKSPEENTKLSTESSLTLHFTESEHSDDGGMTTGQIAGMVVGITVGVAVAAALLAVLLFRTQKTVGQPRILAICCSNIEPHVTTVRKFLKFLEAKCNVCVVVIDNNCTMSAEFVQDWLLEEINLAKKVVLFQSEESTAMAYLFTRLTVTPSVALKTFISALEMFSQSKVDQSKLVNVYFSYTPSCYVVNIDCGHTYQLMTEFDKFLTNVRSSSGFDSSSLLACDEGRELQSAIDQAAAYAEAHPIVPLPPFVPPDDETDTKSIDTQSLASLSATNGGSNLSEVAPTCSEILFAVETNA